MKSRMTADKTCRTRLFQSNNSNEDCNPISEVLMMVGLVVLEVFCEPCTTAGCK